MRGRVEIAIVRSDRGILLAGVVVLITLPLGVAAACWIVAMYSKGPQARGRVDYDVTWGRRHCVRRSPVASRSNSAGVWWRASGKVDGYSMCIDRFMMEGYLFGVCRASHPAPEQAGQGGKTYLAPTPGARKHKARLAVRAKCLSLQV
jgi:hypothetical protein